MTSRNDVPQSLPLWCLLAALLVVGRCFVFVHWEQAHFDSDQAIVGLMTMHLSELKTWPLFFYGQTYMLGVEAWLAAPLFAVFGPSVTVLKLPLLAMDVAVAVILVRTLARDVKITPAAAFVSSMFFIVPPIVPSAKLVEVMGGSVEPFLYVLLLWQLRRRPVLFGLLAGFGFLHREFTVYGVVAVTAIELSRTRLSSMTGVYRRALSLAIMAATVGAILFARGHAALLGPGSAGPASQDLIKALAHAGHLCLVPSAWQGNLHWLVTENLGTLFGTRVISLPPYFHSTLTAGHPAAAFCLAVLAAALVVTIVRRSSNKTTEIRDVALRSESSAPSHMLPVYLIAIGAQAALVYAFLSCEVQDIALTRYTLLVLLAPIGAIAWFYRVERWQSIRWLAGAAVVGWSAFNASDGLRLLDEYLRHPPANEIRELTECLEGAGVRYARAPYWTAYVVDFLSHERVVVASTEMVRISEYQQAVEQHADEAVTILNRDGLCPADSVMVLRSVCVVGRPH